MATKKRELLEIPYPLPTSAAELGVLREKLVARVADLDRQLSEMPKADGRRHGLIGEKTGYQGHLKTINKALAEANRKANGTSPPDQGPRGGTRMASDAFWNRPMPEMGTMGTILDSANPDGVTPLQRWLLTIASALIAGGCSTKPKAGSSLPFNLDLKLLRKHAENVLQAFAPELLQDEDFSATPDQIEQARDEYGEEGSVEFDDDAQMSKGDDDGVWVQGWFYLEEDPSPLGKPSKPGPPRWSQEGIEDKDLSVAELDDKYNPDGDGEHPKFHRGAWRTAVANEDTSLGYWEWLHYTIQSATSAEDK